MTAAGQELPPNASGPAAAPDVTPMFPLMLDVSTLTAFVVGGPGCAGRITALVKHGCTDLHVFCPTPDDAVAAAGGKIERRWPEPADFEALRPKLVFAADVDDERGMLLHSQARIAGALVHVQDRIPFCDFHLPAIVRRGHLQVTVSTDGTAAGLSRLIREYLEREIFGPEWAARVDEVAAARKRWKLEGLTMAALAQNIAGLIAARGWFKKT